MIRAWRGRVGRWYRVLRFRGPWYPVVVLWRAVVPSLAYRLIHERGVLDGARRRTVVGMSIGGLAFGLLWALVGAQVAATSAAIAVVAGGWAVAMRGLRLRRELAGWTAGGGQASEAPVKGSRAHLGVFDNDGRLMMEGGRPLGVRTIGNAEFVRRRRFDLELVRVDSTLQVQKHYRGDIRSLLREAEALARLTDVPAAPRLHGVDLRRCLVKREFVEGPTVRDLLVDAGAKILSVEIENDPEVKSAPGMRGLEIVWERARKALPAAVAPGFLEQLANRLDMVHRAGVTGFSLTYGNVVVSPKDGAPVFIDFDKARTFRDTRTLMFRRARDRDRQLLNRVWGTRLITEADARETLASFGAQYAPVDLGGGLVTHGFWSVDSGAGRWEVLNRRVLEPFLPGASVLDLGTNNAVMALLMLRDGARKVTAIERSSDVLARARLLHRLFEWRYMRRFDLELVHDDMECVLGWDAAGFDLVTAFCSLYYLPGEEMARIARRVAEISPVFVVQAKIDTRADAGDEKAIKSSLPFLCDLLAASGFSDLEVVAPRGYPRPLIIAKKR